MAGESYHLIEKKDGFENARCFIQDHNGFFWIGTTEGVLRYNGHEVDKLEDLLTHEPPALRDITALHLDNTGNIWIGARGKVDRLSVSSMTLDEVHMVSGDSSISRLPEINDIHFVDNDRLLVSTFQGLYILTRRSTRRQHLEFISLQSTKPNSIGVPSSGFASAEFSTNIFFDTQGFAAAFRWVLCKRLFRISDCVNVAENV